MLNGKAKRIMEGIYEIVSGIGFMPKDIEGKTIALDKKNGKIEIQDFNGERVLYTIQIS